MTKQGLTQWQYNKMKILINMLMNKYFEQMIDDVMAFAEREGIDYDSFKVKWGLHGKKYK